MIPQFINDILNLKPQIIIGYLFSISAIISAIFILFERCRDWSIKLTAIFLVSTIALIANNIFVYVASLFIIATLFTERGYLLTLIAIMIRDPEWLAYQKMVQGKSSLPKKEAKRKKTDMEYRILNTLWTKQVIYYPRFSALWGFRINASAPDYMKFREAANLLIGEEFIRESDQGQYFLTRKGIEFCAKNYKTFRNPEKQYWPEEKFTEENLRIAIKKAKTLS